MTAMQNTRTLESQKQRYSRELAAYTLRQWDFARQAMEAAEHQPQDKSPSRSSRPSSCSSQPEQRSSRTQGVQAIDYARRSAGHANGGKNDGRIVAAEN